MSDLTLRLVLVAGVIAIALLAAFLGYRRSLRTRVDVDVDGFGGRVLFFTERSCAGCDRVRAMLSGVDGVVEYRHEDDPERLADAGVTAVPVLVMRDATGGIADRIAGVPSVRRLSVGFRRAGITKSSYSR
jgi:hypothetical protein